LVTTIQILLDQEINTNKKLIVQWVVGNCMWTLEFQRGWNTNFEL